MRKVLINILATTGVSIIALAVIASCYQASFLCIETVFQSLLANILIHIGIICLNKRDAVSNKISAVINQVTGVLIGVILLFLALFINFQDNQRDMDILRLIGYQNKEIRRLFVDVYLPIVFFFFLISAFPSVMLAKAIQKGISLSIQDYLPFGINIKVFVVMFIMMGLLYGCVWGSFVRKLRKYDKGL